MLFDEADCTTQAFGNTFELFATKPQNIYLQGMANFEWLQS